jgi:hypothetical protein
MSQEPIVDIYEPVILELRSQIEDCQRTIAMLEMMRSKGKLGVGHAAMSSAASPQSVAFTSDSFFGMTIADGAKKYLAAIKRTATAKVVSEALIAGGMKSSAKSPTENVRSILSRNPSFVLVNGEFGLSEWYPGRKSIKRIPIVESGSSEEPSAVKRPEVTAYNPIEDVIEVAS